MANKEIFRKEYSIPLNDLSLSQVILKYRKLERQCERLFNELDNKDELLNSKDELLNKIYKRTMKWIASVDTHETNIKFENDLLDLLHKGSEIK